MYRLILRTAGAYNIAFGIWAALWPQAFFDLFELDPPRHPQIWACLGMVVGLYGLVYLLAASRLETAKPLIAIGLAGKVLGPIGWAISVRSGEWPIRTFTLVSFNDLIWWMPFALFLLEGTRLGARLRGLAPFICAGTNALAALALLLILKPGTEVEADLTRRAAYIAEHLLGWRAGWLLWYAAAATLLGFYAWWAARLPRQSIGIAAWCLAAVGIASDWTAESLYIGWLPAQLDSIQRLGTILTGGVANGLYSVAGAILTLSTPNLPRSLLVLAWLTWVFGFGLSAAAFAGHVAGMVAAAAGLMPLFCLLACRIGLQLRS
ncbi:MAG TPA: hypothetical protein VGB99_05935 [Acidobacteriota bacterium]